MPGLVHYFRPFMTSTKASDYLFSHTDSIHNLRKVQLFPQNTIIHAPLYEFIDLREIMADYVTFCVV